jgi:ATP-binding protein involved in chromosome partitioning
MGGEREADMWLGRKDAQVTREQVLEALRDVQDPELHRSIVDLDMVRDVRVRDGHVHVDALLTIQGCPLRQVIVESIRERVARIPGVRSVDVSLGVMSPEERQALIARLRGR